jgi:hypothetical protein
LFGSALVCCQRRGSAGLIWVFWAWFGSGDAALVRGSGDVALVLRLWCCGSGDVALVMWLW